MPRAEWTGVAEHDLEEIAYRIALEGGRPVTADKIVREIRDKAELYARNPESGTQAPELGSDCRIFSHKRWVVIYLPADFGIRVIDVVDAARDYPGWQRGSQ